MCTCFLCTVVSLCIVISSLTVSTLCATYNTYATSNITSCSSASIDDHCILHCDVSNMINHNNYSFNCGHSGYCSFLCEEYKCAQYAVINALNTGSLTITSSAAQCLQSATINLPNYGDAYISPKQAQSLQGTTIHSGTNTGDIIIDCSFNSAQCIDIIINAESATFLKIIVGAASVFGGDYTLHYLSQINCPINSGYNGEEVAPCIIDLSAGGLLRYVEINTLNGIPHDLWITTGNISMSKVYIKCNDGDWSMNNGENLQSEQCWKRYSETTNVFQTNLVIIESEKTTRNASSQPDLLELLRNTDITNFFIIVLLGLFIGFCVCCGCCIMVLQCQQFKHNKEMNNVINNFMSSINNMLCSVGVYSEHNAIATDMKSFNNEADAHPQRYIVSSNDHDAVELEMEQQRMDLNVDTMMGGAGECNDRGVYNKYDQLISPTSYELSSRTFKYNARDGIDDNIVTGNYNCIQEDDNVSEETYSECSDDIDMDGIETETMNVSDLIQQNVLMEPFDDDNALRPTHKPNARSVDIMDILESKETELKGDTQHFSMDWNTKSMGGNTIEIGSVIEIKDKSAMDVINLFHVMTISEPQGMMGNVMKQLNDDEREHTHSMKRPDDVEYTQSKEFTHIRMGSDEFVIDDDDESFVTKRWDEQKSETTKTHCKNDTEITMLDGKPTRMEEFSDYETRNEELAEEDEKSEDYDHEEFEEFEEFELDDYEGKSKREIERNRVLSEGPKVKNNAREVFR